MRSIYFVPFCFLFVFFFPKQTVFAQVSNYNFSQFQGNYTSIVTPTSFHLSNYNGANFADDTMHYGSAQTVFRGFPIGFNFIFNGDTQNVFGISSSGYMVLGKNSVITYPYYNGANPISGTGVYKVLSPLGGRFGFGAIKVSYATSGSAPNRILTAQWKNFLYQYDPNNPNDRDSIDFQVKLFESSNKIQFVYGAMKWCKLNSNVTYEVGIKGFNDADFNSRQLQCDWQKTIPTTNANGSCRLGKKIFPLKGTILEFSPPLASCDSASFPGVAFAKSHSVCGTEKVELNTDSMKISSAVNWQWQSSSDSINWTDIFGANLRNYSALQFQTTYYRCKITCGSTTYFTNVVFIYQLKNAQCYCKTGGANYASAINIGKVILSSINSGSAIPQENNSSNFKRYSDNTFRFPALLEQGGNCAISIQPIYKSTYEKVGAYAFIDFNKDGDFLDANEAMYLGKSKSSVNGYEIKHFVQVPANADTGITLLRISLYGVNSTIPPISACTNQYDGETEDYLVRIIPAAPCVGLPVGVAPIALNSLLCLNDTLTLCLSHSINVSYSYQWYSSSDTINWQAITGANATNYSTGFTQAGYYRCKIKCSGDSLFTPWIYISEKPKVNCFCKSQSSFPTASKITKVELGSFVNTSAFAGLMYSNYLTLDTIQVVKGGSYQLSVEIQSPTYEFGYVHVFIDYNQNGNYDSGESFSMGQSVYSNSAEQYEVILQFPNTIPSGLCLLRIFDESQNYGPWFCNNGNMDEVEDYMIEIQDANPCVNPINAGIAQANDSAICVSSLAHITLSGILYSPNYAYQWQVSSDSISWNNVLNETLFSLTYNQGTTTFYRCRISCSGDTAFSIPVKVAKKTGYACCQCQTNNGLHDDIGNVTFAGISYGVIDSLDLKVNPSNENLGNAYTDFTDSLAPFVIEQNGNYPLSFTEIYSSAPFSSVNVATIYIDFNQNERFDSNEVFTSSFIDAYYIYTGSALIHVPPTAALGLTRMRIILSYAANFIFPPCNPNLFTYETEDYLVNVVPAQACTQPIAGTLYAHKESLCNWNPFQVLLVGNSNYGGQSYEWQSSFNDTAWTTIPNCNASSYAAGSYASTYYRCIVSCGMYSDTTPPLLIRLKSLYQCGCINQSTNPYYFDEFDIGNVHFGNLNNGNAIPQVNNPTAINQYSDFTALAPPVFTKGTTYPLSVTQSSLGNFYRCHVLALLDFNHDSNYSNDEIFDMGTTSDSSLTGSTLTQNITIPYYAISGTTELRICLAEESIFDNTPLYSCSHFYNEVEAYGITIAPDNYCQQLVPGVAHLTTAKACRYENFYVYLTGNTPLEGPVYTWQASVDSLSWFQFKVEDNPYTWEPAYSALYYRCKINCDTFIYYSTPVKLQLEDTALCANYTNNYWNVNQYLGGSDCDTNNLITHVSIDWTSLNNSDSTCYDIGYDKHYYYHAYGNFTAKLQPGKTYSLNVRTTKNDVISAWIDYNHNNKYESTEWISICDTSVAGVTNSKAFVVPVTAMLGKTMMRVRSRYHDNPNSANDGSIRFFSGETEDYILTIDTSTAIPELPENSFFSIYPNPTKSTIQVNSNALIQQIAITDMPGKIVMEMNPEKQTNTIDITGLAEGIYLVQCKFKGGKFGYKKIVIQK